MPYNRSWYALRTDAGWLLGPSKYIGYQNLSPEEYLGSPYSAERHGPVVQRDKSGMPLDGRVTEGMLQRWSELVEEGHPDYESLHSALNALCARYGKKPNSLARISMVKEGREAAAPAFSDELVSLLAAVFRGLTPAQKSEFRRQNCSSLMVDFDRHLAETGSALAIRHRATCRGARVAYPCATCRSYRPFPPADRPLRSYWSACG